MFSEIDKSLKVLSEDYDKHRRLMTAQSDRMLKHLIEMGVERTVLSAEDVEVEMETLKKEEEFLTAFAWRVSEIKRSIDDLVSGQRASVQRSPRPNESVVTNNNAGWMSHFWKRREPVALAEPELQSFDSEQFNLEVGQRKVLLDTLVSEVETLQDEYRASLEKWVFHCKVCVVDLSRKGAEKYFVDISLYESLVSVFSHHASKYGNRPFKLSYVETLSSDEVNQFSEEMGAVLYKSLSEELRI